MRSLFYRCWQCSARKKERGEPTPLVRWNKQGRGPLPMIHFACKTCGKLFERPDAAAGTLVFCDCGTGNRVPWESTATAPAIPVLEEAAAAGPSAGRAVP